MDIVRRKSVYEDKPSLGSSVRRFLAGVFSAALPIAKEDRQQGKTEARSAEPVEGLLGAERIVLSERDTKRVLELLKNPPKELPPALVAAARRRPDAS